MKPLILIVEDDQHIALGLEEILKSEGFEVAAATRGDEGLKMVPTKKPALIILDVMLPGLRWIRCLQATSRREKTHNPF